MKPTPYSTNRNIFFFFEKKVYYGKHSSCTKCNDAYKNPEEERTIIPQIYSTFSELFVKLINILQHAYQRFHKEPEESHDLDCFCNEPTHPKLISVPSNSSTNLE